MIDGKSLGERWAPFGCKWQIEKTEPVRPCFLIREGGIITQGVWGSAVSSPSGAQGGSPRSQRISCT